MRSAKGARISEHCFPHVRIVVDKSHELTYTCAIFAWGQVVGSFNLFIEGFDSISSDPVPKIFKLSPSKETLACIDFEPACVGVAQNFVQMFQMIVESNCQYDQKIVNAGSCKFQAFHQLAHPLLEDVTTVEQSHW